MTIRRIEPGTPEYAQANEVRYETLYRHLGLPRRVVEDSDTGEHVNFAAFCDDSLIGFARLRLEDGDSTISQVAVSNEFRGRGIGRALTMELAKRARAAGRGDVKLKARVEVIAFYERLGFVTEGEEFLSERTGTPHKHMRRSLTDS